MTEVQLKSQMLMHIAYTNMHMSKTEYTIIKPKTLLDGVKFYSESCTKKRGHKFGKSETVYYWNYEDKETFETLEDIMKSKNLTLKSKID